MARRRCVGQHWCPKLVFWEDADLCLQGRRWLQSGRSGAGAAPLGSITLARSLSRW